MVKTFCIKVVDNRLLKMYIISVTVKPLRNGYSHSCSRHN